MINFEKLSAKAHRIVVIAEFHQSDAQQVVEFAKAQNEAGGGGNLLVDVTSMADFTLSSIIEELVHIPTLLKSLYGFERIAIVSDEKWIRTAARLESALLPGVTYQVYDDDEADAALAWVLEESEEPHSQAFHAIETERQGIAAYVLSGRLDREQSEHGISMVRAALEDPDCSRLMIVIRNWHGFDAETVLSREVVSGKLELMKKLDRYAIVGGPGWIADLVGMVDGALTPHIRAFKAEEETKALDWLSE